MTSVRGVSEPLPVCVMNATDGQRALAYLGSAPQTLFKLAVFVLVAWLLLVARGEGPFVPRVHRMLMVLGWFVIAGSVVASVAHGVAGAYFLASAVTVAVPLKDDVLSALYDAVLGPRAGRLRSAYPGPHHAGRLTYARRPRRHGVMPRKRATDMADDIDSEQAIEVRLGTLLAERSMTLTELSELVGITLVHLSVLKNGQARAIRFSTLAAICDALGCQPGDVLTWRGPGGSP